MSLLSMEHIDKEEKESGKSIETDIRSNYFRFSELGFIYVSKLFGREKHSLSLSDYLKHSIDFYSAIDLRFREVLSI